MKDKFRAETADRERAQRWLNKNGFGKICGIVHPTVVSLGEEFFKVRLETEEKHRQRVTIFQQKPRLCECGHGEIVHDYADIQVGGGKYRRFCHIRGCECQEFKEAQ